MRTQIAVGVIYNKSRDKVLLARRPESVSQGGLWEFPGGKVLPGERIEKALERELVEELDLRVLSCSPLITIDHDYPELSVTLNVWSINDWHGQVKGKEGQHIEWVPINSLREKNFPEANQSIITSVRIPHLYLITPDLYNYDQKFFDDFTSVLETGVKLIQFRSKRIPLHEAKEIIRNLLKICNKYSCKLLVNGDPKDISDLGCHGVHLTSDMLLSLNDRPLPMDKWIAASCHNLMELEHAAKIHADFAVLSPVKKTGSHPGMKTMGWNMFRKLARISKIPVYALGGMTADDVKIACENGGQGIAMISGIWDAKDKEAEVRRILEKK